MAPGHAKPFYPIRFLEGWAKPFILVTGDEASKVWILSPENIWDPNNWNYVSTVIFDLNDYYGPGATQSPMEGTNGVTNSTVGAAAIRYDTTHLDGRAEIYVPAFEAKDVHVFSFRRTNRTRKVQPLDDITVECPDSSSGPSGTQK